MIFHAIIVAVLAASATAKTIVAQVGADKWADVVWCWSSFDYCNGPQDYEFTSVTGEPLQIYCPLQGTLKCSEGNVTFSDGVSDVKLCERSGPFQMVAKSSKVTLTIPAPGVFMQCSAKAVHAPRKYENVALGQGVKQLNAPNSESLYDQIDDAWKITAPEGHKISVTCRTTLESPVNSECMKDVLTIDGGKGPQKYCGNSKVSATSIGTEMTMRLEQLKRGNGRIQCEIKAIAV